MNEQRKDQRIVADHDVVIQAYGYSSFTGKIRNISRQGMYIVAGAFPPDKTAVDVRFALPTDHPDGSPSLSAVIVHRCRNGMGLSIDLTQPEAAARLRSLAMLCQEYESHNW